MVVSKIYYGVVTLNYREIRDMSKKKIIIIGVVLLILVSSFTAAVPVFAAVSTTPSAST